MKKLIIIAAAVATLAACSKNEVYRMDSPISFAPNALSTKALILPNGNSGEQTAFPTTESFNVFAFADLDGNESAYTTNYKTPLMNDVNISNQNGDWKASPINNVPKS